MALDWLWWNAFTCDEYNYLSFTHKFGFSWKFGHVSYGHSDHIPIQFIRLWYLYENSWLFNILEAYTTCNLFSIKLQRSLYELKQLCHMWYQCLSEYLIKEGYMILFSHHVCSLRNQNLDLLDSSLCWRYEFDWNSLRVVQNYWILNKEFEVKDLGKLNSILV